MTADAIIRSFFGENFGSQVVAGKTMNELVACTLKRDAENSMKPW